MPRAVFRGILSHRCSAGDDGEQILLVGGSYARRTGRVITHDHIPSFYDWLSRYVQLSNWLA